jgi:hypothetical protein
MKHSIAIIAISLQALTLQAQVNTATAQLGKTKIITKPKGGAQYVFESPNANFICYSGTSLNTVYVHNLKKKKTKLIYTGTNCGYFPAWASNSGSVYMRNKYKQEGKYLIQTINYNLATGTAKPNPTILPQSINGAIVDENTMVYINEKLQLVKYTQETKQTVVIEPNKQCYQPIVSPNKQHVAVHIGADVWVYDITGNTPAYSLGQGLVSAWAPNSQYLIGHFDESKDGHEISGSELYVFNIVTKTKTKITNTPNIVEMNPSFSANGKTVYYIDSKTGFIYNAPITFN